MVWLGRTCLVIIASILQVSALPTLAGSLPVPNIIFIGVILYSLRLRWSIALLWAFLGGFILDVFTPGRGFYALAFIGSTALLRLIFRRSTSQPPLFTSITIMLIASLALPLIELLVAQTWSPRFIFSALANLIGLVITAGYLYLGRKPSSQNQYHDSH